MASMQSIAQAMARRRKPPQSLGSGSHGQYFIPGLGDYGRQQNIRAYQARHPLHDDAVNPKGTGPFRRRRRGRTAPTPGSSYNAHRPQPN
jgi:hypothetical protein